MKKKRVFLVAGGTGGHIFPAIALTEINKKYEYIFLVDYRTKNLIKNEKKEFYKIISSRLNTNIFLLPLNLLKIFLGILQTTFLILKLKPSLIIGFGGYTSIPSILAGKMMKIKTVIHEQNSIMGKANRLLSLFSDKTALTFKNTKYKRKDAIFTGIPVRKIKIKKLKNKKGKKVLVLGGSQGARVFSKILPKILERIKGDLKKKILVTQQVRAEDISELKKIYEEMKINFKLKTFFTNVYNEILESDIIISRCGSSTLAEIELYNKFSILFPFPNAMDNHQYYNALEFKKRNSCIIIDEKKINYQLISQTITNHLFRIGKAKNENVTKPKLPKKPLKKLLDELLI